MNRKIIIALLIAAMLVAVVLAGCEIFEGSPIRDNLNDPNNELDYSINISLENGIDYIGVRWDKSGDIPYDFDYQIVYGTDPDVNSGSNDKLYVGGDQYDIGDLSYGTAYNIWLRGIEKDSDENVIFSKYISGMPEARGELDSDFAVNGAYSIPYADTASYDIISDSDNNILVAAGYGTPTKTQIFIRLAYDGLILSTYGTNGVWYTGFDSNEIACAQLSSGDFVSFIKQTTADYIYYYYNDSYRTNIADRYFCPQEACGTDNGYMFVAGENGAATPAFSVVRFDSSLDNNYSAEYSVDNYSFSYTVNGSRASDVFYNNGKIYAAGWIQDDTNFYYHVHAVIINPDNMNTEWILELNNGDWDDSSDRVIDDDLFNIVGPQIAADNENNVFLAGRGILTKFSENGSVFDADEEWGNYGSITLPDGILPVDLLMQENGKIILVAKQYYDIYATATFEQSLIFRFNADGSYDENFGPDGDGSFKFSKRIAGADIKPDGRIVITTTDYTTSEVCQIE